MPPLKNTTANTHNTQSHIILVEDDVDLLRMLSEFLQKNGFAVSACEHFEDMLAVLVDSVPDLFVLDLMLPDKNGIEISQYIRSTQGISTLPILILTAQDNELLEVTALNEGATSYLTKPIRPHVLLAHINALLRQHATLQHTHSSPTEPQSHAPQKHEPQAFVPPSTNPHLTKNTIENIGLHIHQEKMTATLNNQPLTLSTAEFELLNLLYAHRGKTISRDFLMNNVRGMAYDGLNRSVDMRISTLRKKLGDHKPPYQFIKTIRGKGYLFVDEDSQD